MRKQARVLGLVAAAAVLFAACSGTTATPAPASRPPPGQPAGVPAPVSRRQRGPGAARRRPPRRRASGSSSSGRRRPSSPATSRPRSRATTTPRTSTSTFVDGGPTVVPQQVGSAPDGPEFTISWVPKVLEARESGSDLVDIAQIFQRSGTLSVTWKDSGLDDPCKFAGKKVGVWDFGNEFEVTAGLLRTAA